MFNEYYLSDEIDVFKVNCSLDIKLCKENVVDGYPSLAAIRAFDWSTARDCIREGEKPRTATIVHYHGVMLVSFHSNSVFNFIIDLIINFIRSFLIFRIPYYILFIDPID